MATLAKHFAHFTDNEIETKSAAVQNQNTIKHEKKAEKISKTFWQKKVFKILIFTSIPGVDPGAPLTTKNEAPAPKFYKIEAPEWQF